MPWTDIDIARAFLSFVLVALATLTIYRILEDSE